MHLSNTQSLILFDQPYFLKQYVPTNNERIKQKVILIITLTLSSFTTTKGEHQIYLDARLFTTLSLSVTTGLSQHSVFVKPGIESALKTGSFLVSFALHSLLMPRTQIGQEV